MTDARGHAHRSVSFTSSYWFVLAVSDALAAGYPVLWDVCMTYEPVKGHKVVSGVRDGALASRPRPGKRNIRR